MPACLCKECQLYDVKMSCRSEPSTFWSSLLSCESCSVAESMCGLAHVDVPKRPRLESAPVSSFVPVAKPAAVSVRLFLSHLCLGFAASSLSCFLPSSLPVADSPCSVSTVAASSVQSSSVAASSVVTASSVACFVSTVAAPPVHSISVIASSGPVAASSDSCPVCSVAASSVHWSPCFAAPVCSPRVQRPLFWPRPLFIPVTCLVWIVVPVLLAAPFGFVLSFLPLVR